MKRVFHQSFERSDSKIKKKKKKKNNNNNISSKLLRINFQFLLEKK